MQKLADISLFNVVSEASSSISHDDFMATMGPHVDAAIEFWTEQCHPKIAGLSEAFSAFVRSAKEALGTLEEYGNMRLEMTRLIHGDLESKYGPIPAKWKMELLSRAGKMGFREDLSSLIRVLRDCSEVGRALEVGITSNGFVKRVRNPELV